MKLVDARVLLTGATGGIGKATAAKLVNEGASVMLVGRSREQLSAQTRLLIKTGAPKREAQVTWYPADLTINEDIASLAEVAAEWGCNVVVHGAGIPGFGRLATFEPNAMAEVLHTNLLAPVLLTQAMLPYLCELPKARILFVGSVLGRLGLPGFSVYSASKFGLRGFAESLRRELGDTAVGVQYLGPRSTRTDFNSQEAERFNEATGTRSDEPKVVAEALLALLESGAAEKFIGVAEAIAVRLNGLAPTWLDGSFAKHRASLAGTPSHSAEIEDTEFEAVRNSLIKGDR